MFGLKEYIVNEIVSVIYKYSEVEKACIFGSRATESFHKTSDIDLAIFSSSISSSKLNLLRNDIDTLDIIYKVDVVHFESLRKEALKDNIMNEGIEIYNKGMRKGSTPS